MDKDTEFCRMEYSHVMVFKERYVNLERLDNLLVSEIGIQA